MSTTLLTLVDRFTQKLGPISSTIDSIVGHIVPQKTVSACTGVFCGNFCLSAPCTCLYELAAFYAQNGGACLPGVYSCHQGIGCDPVCCLERSRDWQSIMDPGIQATR